ncbi:MAG: hypothetical protein BGN86_10100 [Caulobacterales bacterium 68-7]|nr:hypothetical protein [Caulobacterales bacterium]OJU11260.1 MAG: hypothetical protein BGN86_10100 [Caulobacterales bacterium 68-7]
MSNPARSPHAGSISRIRIVELRKLVEDARDSGIDLKKMELQVTQRDESIIKLSRDVAVSEVSFVEGQMIFLGVKLVRSATAHSSLQKAATA